MWCSSHGWLLLRLANERIGRYSRSTTRGTKGSFEFVEYTVEFINGTKMATVRVPWDKMERRSDGIMEIETEYDGKLHAIEITEENATFDIDSFEQACAWLVQRGYL